MTMGRDEIFRKICVDAVGYEITEPTKPIANYEPAVRSGSLLFLAGQGPILNGKEAFTGKLGGGAGLKEGYRSARLCALNSMALLKRELGTLEKVSRIVYLRGLVNSTDDFAQQPAVINGASDALKAVFGDSGAHARCAISVNSLPDHICTEIELIVEV